MHMFAVTSGNMKAVDLILDDGRDTAQKSIQYGVGAAYEINFQTVLMNYNVNEDQLVAQLEASVELRSYVRNVRITHYIILGNGLNSQLLVLIVINVP